VPNKFIRVFTQGIVFFFFYFLKGRYLFNTQSQTLFYPAHKQKEKTYLNIFKLRVTSQLYQETVGSYREIKILFLNMSMRLNRAGTPRTQNYGYIYILLFIKFLRC